MKWRGRRKSRNVIDRRRSGATSVGGMSGLGIVAVVIIGYFLGVDVTPLLEGSLQAPKTQGELSAADQERAEFVTVALADTELVWTRIFEQQVDGAYDPPRLVLFSGATGSACGAANAATGPFYCPADKMIYLDTDFFVTLSGRLGAKGDFAAAYVVAHEVAHSVQDQLGILGDANRIRAQVDQTRSNEISVRIELQADCFSGIWARAAQDDLGTLERGDIAEAMNAAGQIGDDALQRGAGQVVRPDSFTHGTSDQRQRWFQTGFNSGELASCDTFSVNRL
ncbi:neutral zinc metallopeptidase [Marivivens sp. LCG002]|uniref:KPN_02809 family neutral zinc metallopeptidase n=1 Tax=Marivivens sp. LCG002 TaxID=3051171 RepID=UPI002557A90A|nr:neutral zinc metallopeptidase [Marivivens sp. LCG002]WIV52253.1 neutral zinc metallopeptidase [Marivivens sp. LCG002]